MWTPATRRQHSREGLRYETDLTDAGWRLVEPLLPAPKRTATALLPSARDRQRDLLLPALWRSLALWHPPGSPSRVRVSVARMSGIFTSDTAARRNARARSYALAKPPLGHLALSQCEQIFWFQVSNHV